MAMNQNPEQRARDAIDRQLAATGWAVQGKRDLNLQAAAGVAVREYATSIGPADYALFVDGKPVGILEAKRNDEGERLSVHEDQAEGYAAARLHYLDNEKLPFVYVSTGTITRFTDFRDPKPRSREVFSFHRPETLRAWLKKGASLRKSIQDLDRLPTEGLRDCQINAIERLEASFKANKPRALVQMATGAGKTFTAITAVYRLLKYTNTRRVLFLVDTRNLGEQAEQEFRAFQPNDDNRKFTELYGVHRLNSRYIPGDNQVYISTIQRLYSILKGQDLEESAEEENPAEKNWQPKEVPPIEYNEKIPVEYFDFIVIDECHRSIYNLWKQVLDYFDAFQVGLTATPDKRAYAYFRQNVVSEYTHEMAIADGVNVGYDVFLIETKVTKGGGTLWKGNYIEKRERLSRRKRFELQDEDETYSAKQLDNDIVNPSQIRMVIRTFRDHLSGLFPDRFDSDGAFEVPKTLVFAKTDSHADDIIAIIREEFDEDNAFCKKITYKAEDDPKSVLASFRNDYHPRVAVTVDMIATGTDVRPLECLLFMRDVKSRGYFEQMKGRGTRIIDYDDLRKVSPTAKLAKDHFVIVDAIGVTKSLKTDSRPLEKKPGVPLRDLLGAVAAGARDEALFTTLAGRLARLDKQLTEKEKETFRRLTEGIGIPEAAKGLLNACNPDVLDGIRDAVERENPSAPQEAIEEKVREREEALRNAAARPFTGATNEYLENVRKVHEQKIDLLNIDEVTYAGGDAEQAMRARATAEEFRAWVEGHRDEMIALRIFYDQPFRRRELTRAMIKELAQALSRDRPALAPLSVWRAFAQLEKVTGQPLDDLTALVALLRRVAGIDAALTLWDATVNANFKKWIFERQAGAGHKFTEEQLEWLRMIRDHIASSVHITADDLDYTPFDSRGGRGRMWQLFGDKMDGIMDELNGAMAG
ncbi:MAG: restriction endonuclease subunit R [Treponema sp. GWB1_62_6]|nr:MAG: restriction endonuclease subunit R [Treponema sp. GWB1_62_6]OHE69009.1 MAG: restriction endonuclease subunit R [Treponema sp. GWC1_61_84]HCM28498.1 restriction endonuclease subunit R [Treponema sp.]